MTASEVSVLFGLGMGIEMLLFYPAGWIMDRFGRVWVAVPVALGFGVTLMALPLADTRGGVGVAVVAMSTVKASVAAVPTLPALSVGVTRSV